MKVTIITVCFNTVNEIEDTILSVLSQTYKDIEYIIVDGGSTDGTLNIIRKYESRISRYISEPDKGLYDAMNKGIAMSTGVWVNFMNAGDCFFDNEVLERMFGNKDYHDVSVIYGDANLVYPGLGCIKRPYSNIPQEDVPLNINHQSSFIKGDKIRELKYDLSYRIASDGNTFMKVYQQGGKFLYVPETIASFEVVSGVSSKQFVKRSKEYLRIRSVKPYSFQWLKTIMENYVKAFIMSIIPADYLTKKQFYRIKNKYSE